MNATRYRAGGGRLGPSGKSRACCPGCCCVHLNNPGKQFLPLDISTLLPVATFRPLLLQVRIRNGYGSDCGYPQTYVRVNSYSSQSVAGVATLRVPATTLVCPAVCQEGLRTLAPGTTFPRNSLVPLSDDFRRRAKEPVYPNSSVWLPVLSKTISFLSSL